MQATITRSGTENANPAGAVNANGVVGKSSIASEDSAIAAQVQAHLDQLTALACAYTRAQVHPGELTMMDLNAQESEVTHFIAQVADVLATLDGRRRALVSEASYRLNAPASARQERRQAVLV